MTFGRLLLAILFTVAGTLHFLFASVYLRIIPTYLPAPLFLVYLSGACEVLGGLGLLVSTTRPLAAWGLIVLLIAVLPANLQMALDHARWPGIPEWLLWVRLPLQLPMVAWVWLYTPYRLALKRPADRLATPASRKANRNSCS